jgi:hypothetical protein
MSQKCQRCGVESYLDGSFFNVLRSFRTTKKTLCPICYAKKRELEQYSILISILGLFVLGLILLFFSWTKGLAYLILNFILLQIFSISAILIHEEGHAVMARFLRMNLFRIILGSGPLLFSTKFLGCQREFRLFPFGGLTVAAHCNSQAVRIKISLLALAGPTTNVMIICILWSIFSSPEWFGFIYKVQWLQVAYLANILTLSNLWPTNIDTLYGKLPSDGLMLLQAFTMNQKQIEQAPAANCLLNGIEARSKKNYETAQRFFDEGLVRWPNDFYFLTHSCVNLIDLKQFDMAREISLRTLEVPELAPSNRLLILNNIAYIDLLLEDPNKLSEADDYSSQAMSGLAWMPAVKGTRGAVLVQTGQYDAAVLLLKQSFSESDEPHSKALNACHLAMCEQKRGNKLQAQEYLKAAQQFDSNCILLPKAHRLLELSCPTLYPSS